MIKDNIYEYIANIVYGFIQLLIIVAAIVLIIKNQNLATVLILTGAVLSGLMQIITPIFYSYYFNDTPNFSSLTSIISLLSGAFYALFGVGLLLLALSFKKQ